MMAPVNGGQVEYHAPLARWETIESFDSAAACVADKGRIYEFADNESTVRAVMEKAREKGIALLDVEAFRNRVANARCIASDDPRLAK